VLFTIRQNGGRARIFHGFGDSRLAWQGREPDVRRETEVGK